MSGGKIRRKISVGRVASRRSFLSRNEREAYAAAARTGVQGRFQRPKRKSLEREWVPLFFVARELSNGARGCSPTRWKRLSSGFSPTKPGPLNRPPSSLDPPCVLNARQWRCPKNLPIQNGLALLPVHLSGDEGEEARCAKRRDREEERGEGSGKGR